MMTRLRHYDDSGSARFVTFSTYRHLPALNDDTLKEIVIDELKALRAKHRINIHGYVLMPDHVHLVLHPPDGQKLGRLVGQLKSFSARRYFAEQNSLPAIETRILWQRRSYDHNCRDTDSVIEKINYCHNNPVKKGLVPELGDWRWSSFNWYQGRVDVPLEIDSVEL